VRHAAALLLILLSACAGRRDYTFSYHEHSPRVTVAHTDGQPRGEWRDLAAYTDHCCTRLGIDHVTLWPAWQPGQVVYAGRLTTHGRYYDGTDNIAVLVGEWDMGALIRHELTHMRTGMIRHTPEFEAAQKETARLCGEGM
jgi:hypothetical protein